MLGLGLVRRVDGAIEQAQLAAIFGCGEQLAVAHVAQLPVPLTVALEAQIQVVQLLGPPKARVVAAHHVDLGVGHGRARRHGDALAEFFLRQLAIEIELACDRLELLAGLIVAVVGLECTAVPIRPGGITIAQAGAHFFNGLAHHLPVTRAQGGAHTPLLRIVRQVSIAAERHLAAVGIQRIGCLLLGGVLADHAPARALLFTRQAAALRQQIRRRLGRIIARHARHVGQRVVVYAIALRQHRRNARCLRDKVLLQRQPRRKRHIRTGELLGLRQIADQVDTAFAIAFGIRQRAARIGGHVLTLHGAREQRIALDLRVVLQHEIGVLGIEGRPVALLAEHEQPIVAQPVGNRLALVALQERTDFVFRRIGAGIAAGIEQLRLDAEILHVRLDRVIGEAVGQLPAARHIVATRSVAQLDKRIVRIGRNALRRLALGGHRQRRRADHAHADHACKSQRYRAIYCLGLQCHLLPHPITVRSAELSHVSLSANSRSDCAARSWHCDARRTRVRLRFSHQPRAARYGS